MAGGARRFVLALVLLPLAQSYEYFEDLMPNGRNVMRNGVAWTAVGHNTPVESPTDLTKNLFGLAWKANGYIWTRDLCNADSDADGQSNGMELGDPFCKWVSGQVPFRTTAISHPGFADSKSTAPVPAAGATAPPPVLVQTTTTTTLPAGTCRASDVKDTSGWKFECMVEMVAGVSLHWRMLDGDGGKVDLALAKGSTAGWLSLGFPKTPGVMLDSHAVVSKSSGEIVLVDLNNLVGAFPTLATSGMRVPFAGAEAATINGKRLIIMKKVQFPDLRKVSVIYGLSDSPWETQHGGTSASRGGTTLDLVSGSSSADDAENEGTDILVYIAVAGMLLIVLLGAWLTQCASKRPPAFWTTQVYGSVTPLGMLGFLGVLVCCALAVAAPFNSVAAADTAYSITLGLGLATALVASVPIWFAFLKAGLHNVFGISREIAWRVHAVFGALFLVLGTTHGIAALTTIGIDIIGAEPHLLAGLIGMVLVLLGVLPALAHSIAPQAVRYDMFKLLHYLACAGYALGFLHVLGQLVHLVSGRLALLMAVNGIALLAWVAQRVATMLSTKKGQITRVDMLNDTSSVHVALTVRCPGFDFAPGQWARLSVPAVGVVGHPFTLVPGEDPDSVCFIVKGEGSFTTSLMHSTVKDSRVRLEGPYGAPPVVRALATWADSVIFVIGGVGITPVLSLSQAARATGKDAFLFWSLRSAKLFRHCTPRLSAVLDATRTHVQLTGDAESPQVWVGDGVEDPGLVPSKDRRSPAVWMSQAVGQLEEAGKSSALVFFCGPPGLAKAARDGIARAAKEHPHVSLRLHEEAFRFIPSYR